MIMEHLLLTFGAISGCHAWGKSSEAALSELVHVFEMIQKENRTQKYPKVPIR